eukprot:gene306-biopygen850
MGVVTADDQQPSMGMGLGHGNGWTLRSLITNGSRWAWGVGVALITGHLGIGAWGVAFDNRGTGKAASS